MSVRGLVLLSTLVVLSACSRAKVKMGTAPSAQAPPARLVVVPPQGGLGLAELGESAGFGAAGAALDSATGKLAEGVGKATTDAAHRAAEKAGSKEGGHLAASVLEKGAGLGEHAEKKRQWFEDAFASAIGGEAEVHVVDPIVGRSVVDCDYRLRFEEAHGKRASAMKASGKLYRTALGGQKIKGSWAIERCADGTEVASDDMKFVRTFRWWMLDFFDRYTFEMDADPVGAMASDYAATEAVRARHRQLAADIEAWRHKGPGLAAGDAIAGIEPASSGDFASPVRADGSLDRWDNRLMAGELVGTVAQEATKAGLEKVVGGGKVGHTVAETGGALVGGVTERAIVKDLPADYFFGDLCSAVAWTDAAYAHRADYRDIVRAMTAAYPELNDGYGACLIEAAATRSSSGVKP